MSVFIEELDGVKKEVRDSIRNDVTAAINRAHYTLGVRHEVATALACEGIAEYYSRFDSRGRISGAQTLRWMADQLEAASSTEENEDGLLYE